MDEGLENFEVRKLCSLLKWRKVYGSNADTKEKLMIIKKY